MSKLKLVLIIALISVVQVSFAQEKEKDVMIKNIVTILKNNDKVGFVKLFPNAEIMKEFLTKLMSKDANEEDGMAEMMNGFINKITDSSLNAEYGNEFDKVMAKGNSKGIEWGKINLTSYTADSSQSDEGKFDAPKLTGKVYFNVDAKEYFMAYDNIIWFEDKGWYGVSIDRIDLKSKENEEEEIMIDELMDSVIAVVDTTVSYEIALDTVMKAPAKPEKKSTTPKPATKPTPSKTKTPARKPQ